MALTLLQFRDTIKKGIGDRADYSDTDINLYLNLAVERIARLSDWKELQQTTDITLSYTGVPATDKSQDISALTDLHRIYDFVIEDNAQSTRLVQKSSIDFDTYVPLPEWYATGNPEIYTIWGLNTVLIWPVIDQGYTARIRWYKYPATMSADVDVAPLLFQDDAIIFLTLSFIFALLREEGQAGRFYGYFLNEMKNVTKDAQKKIDLTVTPNFLARPPSVVYYRDPFYFGGE